MKRALLLILFAASPLVGCSGIQTALAPRGPNAEGIAILGWVMIAGAALILLSVMALTAVAALAAPDRHNWLGRRGLIIGGGIIFPVVTLTALLIYGLSITADVSGPSESAPLRIEVVGEQWWWRVSYLDESGAPDVITANEIRIPVGRPIEFSLKSADVIHSFWVPNLAGKLDMIPGRINRLRLQADEAGVYRGQCAEYCGAQHALMAFYVVAEPPAKFESWLRRQREPAREPRIAFLERGRELFIANGCGACHTIRGTPANGAIGPDLTHVGSRLSIAAGTLPKNAGTLAGWIAGSQHLKPGNRMPSFGTFTGEELRTIAAYLDNLE